MSQVTACRACLVENLTLYRITNSPYEEIYEKLTNAKVGKVYPDTFCYICVSVLRKFKKFATLAQHSNIKLKQWYKSEIDCKPTSQPLFTISTTTVEYVSMMNTDNEEKVQIKLENLEDTSYEQTNEMQYIESTHESDTYIPPKEVIMDDSCIKDSDSWSDANQKVEASDEEFEVPVVKQEPKKRAIKAEKTPKGTPAAKKRKTTKKTPEYLKETVPQEQQDKKQSISLEIGKYKCNLCPLAFTSRRNLKTHLENQHKVDWVICKICKYKAVDESDLLTHNKRHEKAQYICKLCSYKCRSKSDFAKHERVHTGFKPYSCKYCDYKCKSKGDLNRHELTHTKPFKCDLCDYKCSTRQNLKYHNTVVHVRDKQYMCHICSFRVIERSQLRRHLRTHDTADRRKYECNVCDRKFSVKNYLTVHLRVHTGEQPYSCGVCNRKFSQKSALNKHIKQVHNKKDNS